ncbi:ladderlectin-like [Hippoglossus hippoglossus]|uniref:ladderlectin-like n=1 Tax=Hippoglossus hippoglossus TaxID=8267 RepID=UPI00148D3AD3|nr:ladderlectin-like [Hippoglossus hippoglossus]
MKTLLLLTVVLSGVLAVTAKPVEAVEPVEGTQELQEENLASVAENEAGVFVPEAEEPEMLSAGEMAPSVEGRFFVCPAGWERYKSSCYLYVSAGRSWTSAAANCNSLGATMASAHDLFEYSFLQQLTSRGGGSLAWMGGLYFQGWRWVDQSPFNYNFWSAQHAVSRYQCLHLNTRAGWSNNNCANGWPSICRKSTDTC